MAENIISKKIAELRKKKEITQETLADYVGISAQAVSKWESGGFPDIELLPKIADYFGISIDELFGRAVFSENNADIATAKYIDSLTNEQKFEKAFEHCWVMQKSLMGSADFEEHTSLSFIRQKQKQPAYSQILSDNGITLMSIIGDLNYFLLIPEPKEGWRASLSKPCEYIKLFELLGNEEIFNVLFLLYSRENKPFTQKLIEKELKIKAEKTIEILEKLKDYKLISTSEIELDDEVQIVYNFNPTPAFVALLVFAKEMIEKPCSFYYYSGGRAKPFLK